MGGFEMAITIRRGDTDTTIKKIVDVLRDYEADHPRAQIELYRQNPVSVRVRILDPDFAGTNKVERSKTVWKYLDRLSDEEQSDISSLLLLVPDETKMSFANFEFEDPVALSL
jgi:stress-induced morphogen